MLVHFINFCIFINIIIIIIMYVYVYCVLFFCYYVPLSEINLDDNDDND